MWRDPFEHQHRHRHLGISEYVHPCRAQMGGQISVETKISENELVRRFTGLEPITDNDPFWNQLLSFNLASPANKREEQGMEEGMKDGLESLMYNAATTGNFASFVRVALRRASELKTGAQTDDKIFLWQSTNALKILRICATFFSERLTEAEIIKVFCKNVLTQDGKVEVVNDSEDIFENPAEELLNALVEILVDLAVNDLTRDVHRETILCILALLSTQLSQEKPNSNSVILNFLMHGRCAIHAPLLTKTLLRNFLSHSGAVAPPTSLEAGGSLVIGLATSVWSALSRSLTEESVDAEGDEGESRVVIASLGALSLQLLLLLASHSAAPSESGEAPPNPFRRALAAFSNSQEVSTLGALGSPAAAAGFKLDYGALYTAECAGVGGEAEMLLLYLLLHRNSAFRNYVLSRVNLEELLLPVLKVLYAGGGGKAASSHHVYLALIAVLILSEDDFFAKIVHETKLKSVEWYKERVVSDISLGGLIILVLARTIQHNIVKVRDRYLHTNCLAALANMSAFFKNLPASVAQRLVGLLEVLTKRHAKLVDHLRIAGSLDLADEKSNAAAHHEDIMALEEGIRTLLEILNSTLTHALRHNPHLVYTMLYQRALFESFHQHPMFQDLIWNISAVLNHFASRVNALEKGASAAAVLDVIAKGALQWPSDRLKKFPELKFKYVEDESTEEFFVPYVWTLAFRHSGLPFHKDRVRLFNTHKLRH